MFRHVLSIFAACALAAPALFTTTALAQTGDSESAGHSRGGYAWGEEHRDETAAPAVHRYGHGWLSLGAGGTIRIIQYETLAGTSRFAPSYLQLRGGYFFEGDGMFQHGVVLGLAAPLSGDGTFSNGVSAFGQVSIAPSYMVRVIPDGDLGDWFSATGRIGIPLSVGEQFSWGWEAGLGAMLKPLAGFAIYGEIDFSMYFATDYHPLLSFEIGIAMDYEVLP